MRKRFPVMMLLFTEASFSQITKLKEKKGKLWQLCDQSPWPTTKEAKLLVQPRARVVSGNAAVVQPSKTHIKTQMKHRKGFKEQFLYLFCSENKWYKIYHFQLTGWLLSTVSFPHLIPSLTDFYGLIYWLLTLNKFSTCLGAFMIFFPSCHCKNLQMSFFSCFTL